MSGPYTQAEVNASVSAAVRAERAKAPEGYSPEALAALKAREAAGFPTGDVEGAEARAFAAEQDRDAALARVARLPLETELASRGINVDTASKLMNMAVAATRDPKAIVDELVKRYPTLRGSGAIGPEKGVPDEYPGMTLVEQLTRAEAIGDIEGAARLREQVLA
jgi:hypothetical protein